MLKLILNSNCILELLEKPVYRYFDSGDVLQYIDVKKQS